jgi:DNA-3-methyladenine glycosylase
VIPDGGPLPPDALTGPARTVARELIGCRLVNDGVGGVIVETEAYEEHEPACHAFAGPTPRNRPLFGPAGRAYVYLSYGIHHLFNVVTGPEGRGEAVLIRALEPCWGLAEMRRRRGGVGDRELCSGPGKLTAALGIGPEHDGIELNGGLLLLLRAQDRGGPAPPIVTGPRIGISRAAGLPWRYCLGGSGWLSRPPGKPRLSPRRRRH